MNTSTVSKGGATLLQRTLRKWSQIPRGADGKTSPPAEVREPPPKSENWRQRKLRMAGFL